MIDRPIPPLLTALPMRPAPPAACNRSAGLAPLPAETVVVEQQFSPAAPGGLGLAKPEAQVAQSLKSSLPSPAPKTALLLLPGWQERLQVSPPGPSTPSPPPRVVPRCPAFYAQHVVHAQDLTGAEALLDLVRQRPIARIGLACQFQYRHAGVPIKSDRIWHDPRSIVPLLLGLALVEEPREGPPTFYRVVFDLRNQEVLAPLGRLCRLPLLFVAHAAPAELFCLWQLGLPTPGRLWDTAISERAFLLGLHHPRYAAQASDDAGMQAYRQQQADEDTQFRCSLQAACNRRQIAYPFASSTDRLQQSFRNHPSGQPFGTEQCAYAAANAEAAARLYPAQVAVAATQGCLDHLLAVEMPWTVTNARMSWDGVRVDPVQCQQLLQACQHHRATLTAQLTEMGLANVQSPMQVQAFLGRLGLLDPFRNGDGYCFDDDRLEAAEDRHVSIPLIRALRKIQHLAAEPFLSQALTGVDGRLHPDHRQLGTETTRNTMRDPNIGGIGRALRPLVVPEPGWALGEVDLSQIEVGIAAAVYDDPDLIAAFNSGDVYTAMGRRYYAAMLPPEDRTPSDRQWRRKHRALRERMKLFTLATIYNITPHGLAGYLNTTVQHATEEQRRFLALFPALAQALQEASAYGAIRGYAELCTGLRRWRARGGPATAWETNWLRNTPVQGSAAVAFKVAGNRLRLRFEHYRARLVLPLHDAFVFEAPRPHLRTVAKITAEVMRGAVQEYFPVLNPQVEINIDHPQCWNKEGKWRSLRLWMVHPELARRYMKS